MDSNADGYDVLSLVSKRDSALLCIEVKASQAGLAGDFYVTRNEWETAKDLLHFSMHLWDLSASHPRLAVVDIQGLTAHIPHDEGQGQWESARIPFSSFADVFVVVQPNDSV